MFKKSIIAALFSVILTVMLGTSAFAAEETISPAIAEALAEIEEVNTEIYAEIAETQAEADNLYASYLDAYAAENNAEKRAALTAEYDQKVTVMIHNLDVKTQEMTRIGAEKATAAGITVEIVWIPVQFGDRIALIDPIHVVGW